MTVTAPARPHTLAVVCTGSGDDTCTGLMVHAAHSGGVTFSCETTGYSCGSNAKVFCPACDQDACSSSPGAAPSSPLSLARTSPTACSVRCAASETGQTDTCGYMDVYAGPGGADVTCAETGAATSTTRWKRSSAALSQTTGYTGAGPI